MGDLRHKLARGRDGFVADHVGLRGGWAKTETPITRRRSRFAKDLREGTLWPTFNDSFACFMVLVNVKSCGAIQSGPAKDLDVIFLARFE